MIIMQGDTGGGHEVAALKNSTLPQPIRYGMPFPVILVKDFGAQGAMTVSEKPASIQDVPNIVVGALGLEPEFPGFDLMSDVDVSSRRRIFRAWQVEPNGLAASSWSRMKPAEFVAAKSQSNQLGMGDVVSFRGDGLGHLYRRGRGWSGTTAHGTWAYYPEAKLQVAIEQENASQVSALNFQVRLPDAVGPSKHIRYSVNGAAPKDIDFDYKTKRLAFFDIPIPEDMARKEIQLSFLFDAPMNAQISDPRALGFLIEKMTVQ